METIFHKILAGEIPNYTVYEDEHVLAFLSIQPSTKGHTIVIPKHYDAPSLFELPREAYEGYMTGISETLKIIDAVLSPDGYNIGWNVHPAGGQSVEYIHCHIMPRWEGDGTGNMHTIVDSFEGEVADVAALFSA